MRVKAKWGGGIYKIKYDQSTTEAEKISICQTFSTQMNLNEIVKENPNLTLTFIPSSSKIPERLSEIYAKRFNLEIKNLIIKKEGFKVSKGLETWEESLSNAFEKYEINKALIDENSKYFIIDDIFGFGGSMVAVLQKIYDITKKVNFFFCVAKDTKR